MRMRKKRGILFRFWLAEKIQKRMKLFFLTRERKKERKKKGKLKLERPLVKNNSRAENRVTKESAKCRPIVLRKKKQTLRNEDLNFEVSNLMTYESRDEKEPPPAERRTQKKNSWEEGKAKPHCSRSCMEATNLPSCGGHKDSLLW